MDRWSISKRLAVLVSGLLGASFLIAAVGLFSTRRLDGIIEAKFQSREKTGLAADIAEDLFEAQIAEQAYRFGAAAEQADELRQNIEEVLAARDPLSAEFAGDESGLALIQRIDTSALSYLATFAAVESLQDRRNAHVGTLRSQGVEIRTRIDALINLVAFGGSQRSLTALGDARLAFESAQVAMERFLLNNDPEDLSAAKRQFDTMSGRIAAAAADSANAARAADFTALRATTEGYWRAAEATAAAIDERNGRRAELDRLAAEMHAMVEEVMEAAAAKAERLSHSAELTKLVSYAMILAVAALSLIAGHFVSRRISRGIAQGLTDLSEDMAQVADGALDLDIRGTDLQHELGAMARALEVFRENAREARRLADEQRRQERDAARLRQEAEEKERTAEADRQARAEEARRRTVEELRDALGAVVSAGAAGDFSQRIVIDLGDPVLQELADGINTLIANVESGLSETSRVITRIATGDLSDRMRGDFHGTFATLMGSVNDTIETLSQLVSEIAQRCAHVGTDSAASAEQAQELARRAEQQAASLEQTSAAMEEIAASARSSAEGASGAAAFAETARTSVDAAGSVVEAAVAAMSDIRDASDRIGDIVSVIDGIAFQTNLLALNASVEAARAGTAGKGFAVVAAEVRALAGRSSEASQDIKRLIGESGEQVRRGVELVEQTGRTLEEIMQSVRQMAARMEDLTVTAREQAAGVAEVTTAISELDAITQKNAALADQSRDGAQSLMEEAARMRELVAVFRTRPADALSVAAE